MKRLTSLPNTHAPSIRCLFPRTRSTRIFFNEFRISNDPLLPLRGFLELFFLFCFGVSAFEKHLCECRLKWKSFVTLTQEIRVVIGKEPFYRWNQQFSFHHVRKSHHHPNCSWELKAKSTFELLLPEQNLPKFRFEHVSKVVVKGHDKGSAKTA